MDKIDQLIEEFSLIQSLKKMKDRVFKGKSKNKVKKEKSEYFSIIGNDACSKKMASNRTIIDRLFSIESDIEINCTKSNKDFMEEMKHRVNNCMKSKDKRKILKDIESRYICFNSDDGNFWIYDNKNKDVLYRHHEWRGRSDEFNASKKDLSFEDIIKEIDPDVKIEQYC